MRPVIILAISAMLLFPAIAFGAETTYWVTKNPRFDNSPLVCIYEPFEPRARDVITEAWIKETEIGIKSWQVALKSSETIDSNKWDIQIEKIPLEKQSSFDNSECRVEVRFTGVPLEDNYNAVGWEKFDGLKSQITLFYLTPEICGHTFYPEFDRSFPDFCFKDTFQRSKTIGNIAAHEFGHSIGLGHYQSTDPEINKEWSIDPVSSPSIMTLAVHYDETKNPIRQIDIEVVKEIYGYYGFKGDPKNQKNDSENYDPQTQDPELSNPNESSEITYDDKTKIPHWLKNTVNWWARHEITNSEFFSGLRYLIQNEILSVSHDNNLEINAVTKTFIVNGTIQTKSDNDSTDDAGEIPLSYYMPERSDLSKNSYEWIIEEEGSYSINYQGNSAEGYQKKFLKPSDDSIIEIFINEFKSGGHAWQYSNSDIKDARENAIEEFEDMVWLSQPAECVAFVEESGRKDISRIYCVIDDLRVYIFGFGRSSEKQTQNTATIVLANINDFKNPEPTQYENEKEIQNILEVTISSNEIVIPLKSSKSHLSLSGNLANHERGIPLFIDFLYPDGNENQLVLYLTDSGYFQGDFPITSSLPTGEYEIRFSYDNAQLGLMSFSIFRDVPDSIRHNSQLWANGSLPDEEFVKIIHKLFWHNFIS